MTPNAIKSATPPELPFIHPDDMPDLYALKGVGTCMEPVFADGALLVFDKREEPVPGDNVGLIFTPEHAERCGQPGCIKRLKMALPPPNLNGFMGLILVEQINPPRGYSFRKSDVLAVHKCVGTAESAGAGMARFQPNREG